MRRASSPTSRHTAEHGSAAAAITYFDGGHVRFASTAGVRVHGGGSRVTSPRQGYRVYLRREYEAAPIPPGLIFDAPHAHPVRVLMVHNDVRLREGVRVGADQPAGLRHRGDRRRDHVALASGAVLPERRVPGRVRAVRALPPEPLFPRARPARNQAGRRRVRGACGTQIRALTPVTMATAGEIVDIENLTRWFIAIAFCATRDPFQGPSQFRDASRRARTVVLGQLGHGCQLRRLTEQSIPRAAAAARTAGVAAGGPTRYARTS